MRLGRDEGGAAVTVEEIEREGGTAFRVETMSMTPVTNSGAGGITVNAVVPGATRTAVDGASSKCRP
ncbi:hypothetical protein HTV45_15955 [Streptomyces sp. CHD11]|uniref:hypothetical protein n=1 Tax=Streptomyces sp. CHD11 TaxID=2741325 RepID=UPI001BFC4E88|nr:hypothetical protein [Streptomyces sp. CHD11]MBT3152355.1 hypothetical protein [Streptomyces sp. CHD11]